MPDTSVPRVQLGPATLNRKWYIDVDTTPNTASPTWVGVFGVQEFKPTTDTETDDDSDYEGGGYKSETITALGWGVELKLIRKTQASTPEAYDPGQEFLRLAGQQMGLANRVHIRYYEMNGATGPKVEAYEGFAAVAWEPDGGDMAALDKVSCNLTGQGQRLSIAHPAATP